MQITYYIFVFKVIQINKLNFEIITTKKNGYRRIRKRFLKLEKDEKLVEPKLKLNYIGRNRHNTHKTELFWVIMFF